MIGAMNINIKKKGGIIKGGLKYFSQMFEEEEPKNEIQIGLPTDVKHVAHIGWDGPSANAPSWMNEFKSQSAPLDGSGEARTDMEDDDDKGQKGSSSRDMPGLPKTSRVRHPSMDSLASADESPPGSPTSQGQSIKHKDKDSSKSSRRRKDKSSSKQKDQQASGDEGASQVPNIPKKSRRKKSKDPEGSVRSSTKSKRGSRGGSNYGSEDGSTRFNGGGSMETLDEEE